MTSLAFAPTCYQTKRPTPASAPTARVTVRFQGVTYVLVTPTGVTDPCGVLVKEESR